MHTLVCKSLPSKVKSRSFSGKKYGNEELSGGKFFNWINKISEKKYPEKNKLIEIFVTNEPLAETHETTLPAPYIVEWRELQHIMW